MFEMFETDSLLVWALLNIAVLIVFSALTYVGMTVHIWGRFLFRAVVRKMARNFAQAAVAAWRYLRSRPYYVRRYVLVKPRRVRRYFKASPKHILHFCRTLPWRVWRWAKRFPGRVSRYFNHGVFRAFFFSEEHFLYAYGWLSVWLISITVQTVISLWLNTVFGATTSILADHVDHLPQEFYDEMWKWFWLSFVNDLIVVVPTYYLSRRYALRWQTVANAFYENAWNKADKKREGAQKLEQDLPNFINTFLNFSIGLATAVVTLIGFLPKLWIISRGLEVPYPWWTWDGGWTHYYLPQVPGLVVWVLLAICGMSTIIVWFVGMKLQHIEGQKRSANAAYRAALVYTEDYEIYPWQKHVRLTPFDHFGRVIYTQVRYFHNIIPLEMCTATYSLIIEVMPYYMGVQSLFAGAIAYGVITQLIDAFGNAKSSLQFFIDNRSSYAVLQALHGRITELESDLGIAPKK